MAARSPSARTTSVRSPIESCANGLNASGAGSISGPSCRTLPIDADDRPPRRLRIRSEANARADRVAGRKESLGERLVHDDDLQRLRGIAVGKPASLQQRNLHGGEVAGRRDAIADLGRFAGRAAADSRSSATTSSPAPDSGRLLTTAAARDAGHGRQALDQVVIELP